MIWRLAVTGFKYRAPRPTLLPSRKTRCAFPLPFAILTIFYYTLPLFVFRYGLVDQEQTRLFRGCHSFVRFARWRHAHGAARQASRAEPEERWRFKGKVLGMHK